MDAVLTEALAPTVAALLRTLLAPTSTTPHEARLTAEMIQRIRGMPRYMGLGVAGLTVVFDSLAVSTHGRRFHQLDATTQDRLVGRWRKAPGGKDMIDFYEKMGTFVFYSLVEESEPA